MTTITPEHTEPVTTGRHWHLATPDANGVSASVHVHGTAFVTLEEAELAAMVTDCVPAECACEVGRADTARLAAVRADAARASLADPKVFPGYHWHAVWTVPGTDTPGAKTLDEESGEWRDWRASSAIYVTEADAVDAVNLFAIHDNSRGVDRRWSASGCACPSGALTVEQIAGGAR